VTEVAGIDDKLKALFSAANNLEQLTEEFSERGGPTHGTSLEFYLQKNFLSGSCEL
jgi:hypothetical protein